MRMKTPRNGQFFFKKMKKNGHFFDTHMRMTLGVGKNKVKKSLEIDNIILCTLMNRCL